MKAGRPERPFLAGKPTGPGITLPDINLPTPPLLTGAALVHNGLPARCFHLGPLAAYPDVRSFNRKFGLILPATNTSMEHELWSIIFGNQEPDKLRGVGLHTTIVRTPKPKLKTEADLAEYGRQFLEGLREAVDLARLAEPQSMILGMSLEHIVEGIDPIRAIVAELQAYSGLAWAAWHDAIQAALGKYQAKRIGLLTPFDKKGNESAIRMFADLGIEVISSAGFACADAAQIAHVPDWAKEKAILELLAPPGHDLDAIVQCGTNMSLVDVTRKLESQIGIPILGINAVTFWYALRKSGIGEALAGAGRLLREF